MREYLLDSETQHTRYSEEANSFYRVPDLDYLLDPVNMVEMIKHFIMYQLPRLKHLDSYYAGNNHGIMSGQRRMNEEKADHRATHGFAHQITDFNVSFLTGIPITVEAEDEQAGEFVTAFNQSNDIDAHNSYLATDLSKYGRGYELLHRGDETEVYVSNPYWTIVVYDESIQMNPVAAIRFPKVRRGTEELYHITLYTASDVIQYEASNLVAQELEVEQSYPHAFGGVPIIEYSNNRYRFGDYERVLSLIDLYDSAQSDTANYMTDTNDALLVIVGDFEAAGIELNKEIGALLMETGVDAQGKQTKLEAKYIHKEYDVNGTESYKTRIQRDIHKFSHTPDLSDEHFSGTQSGEAMKYKLFSLEQSRAMKERHFKQGLEARYQLVENMAGVTREFTGDLSGLDYVFTPNLPESINEELVSFTNAGGRISNKTLLSQLSFVSDVEKELEMLEEEDGIIDVPADHAHE